MLIIYIKIVIKYDYLSAKGGAKSNRDNFINTEEMRKELQKEGVDKDAVRRQFMGIE